MFVTAVHVYINGYFLENSSCTSIIIYILIQLSSLYADVPPHPSNVMVVIDDQPVNFFIIISWESEDDSSVDEYKIMTNTTMQSISTTSKMAVLQGQYNIPTSITILSVNCAGSSTEVTEEVCVGMSCSYNTCM